MAFIAQWLAMAQKNKRIKTNISLFDDDVNLLTELKSLIENKYKISMSQAELVRKALRHLKISETVN